MSLAGNSTFKPQGRRIAVVGSGVAGLTAAYVLNRHDNVTLFEADSRLGGHAHTHNVAQPDGSVLGIDTGFIVHNERTYPTLLRLFAELGVETQDSEMSMSVRCDGCGLEYAGARGAAAASSPAVQPAARTLPADAAGGHALLPQGPRPD
ncbi:protoporphyrinogen oxidase, chloroplastic/mitochondrial [Arthrobacter sp. Hiyo4]|nr:protoporphyrinogen oxidase, chloroplastic/mitochondrial [Arthrobacter sp. Hiyo4]